MYAWKQWLHRKDRRERPVTRAVEPLSPGEEIRQRLRVLHEHAPRVGTRDAASQFGVSEAEVIASGCGKTVARLSGQWADLIHQLPHLGPVRVVTRNDFAVHEKVGRFDQIHIDKAHALVLDPEINLRLFLGRWKTGFAVGEDTGTEFERSLQFYDGFGAALLKVYLTQQSHHGAYSDIVEQFCSEDQSPDLFVTCRRPRHAPSTNQTCDRQSLLADWGALQDVHDVFGLLRKHGLSRRAALELLEGDFSIRLPAEALAQTLKRARDTSVPIMCFLGNEGCVQIHTGPIDSCKQNEPWLSLGAKTFSFQLRTDKVEELWVVKKPTRYGLITSLEVFGPHDTLITQFFGQRDEEAPERAAWRDLVQAQVLQTEGKTLCSGHAN